MNVKWLVSESLGHFSAATTPSKPVGPTKTHTDIRGYGQNVKVILRRKFVPRPGLY
jgi:hypothetical protein